MQSIFAILILMKCELIDAGLTRIFSTSRGFSNMRRTNLIILCGRVLGTRRAALCNVKIRVDVRTIPVANRYGVR